MKNYQKLQTRAKLMIKCLNTYSGNDSVADRWNRAALKTVFYFDVQLQNQQDKIHTFDVTVRMTARLVNNSNCIQCQCQKHL